MSHRLVCGLSRKVGLPNFGSVGATCSLEIDIDPREFSNSESLQAKVRDLFRQCDVAIAHELTARSELTAQHAGVVVAEQSSAAAHNQTGQVNMREPLRVAGNTVPAANREAVVNSQAPASANGNSKTGSPELDRHQGQANGSGNSGNSNGVKRVATQAQQRALHAITNKLSLNLESELQSRFGIRYVGQISLRQASQLIDELKSLQAQSGAVV